MTSDPFPRMVTPELARLVDDPPEGDQWAHEFKFDGYRILAFVNQGKVVLKTRKDQDWTEKFSEVAESLKTLKVKQAIFDGEVVALLPDGTSSFQELQEALSNGKTKRLRYYVFDLLYLNGKDLRGLSLLERKEALKRIVPVSKKGDIQYSRHWIGEGAEIFERCRELGLEGMVSKRVDQPYQGGRGLDWVKTKLVQNNELVIVGYTSSTAEKRGIGALLVGYYDEEKKLHYAGKVGTGFDGADQQDLMSRFRKLEVKKSPLDVVSDGQPVPRQPHWVKPMLVAQLKYTNWTRDDRLRHPVFLGLREDKPAKSVVRDVPLPTEAVKTVAVETVAEREEQKTKPAKKREGDAMPALTKTQKKSLAGLTLTHPERVLYPADGITKQDLVQYYAEVANWILPHLKDRPISLVRCPDGIDGERFFQKHATPAIPESIERVTIKEKEKSDSYLMVNDLAGLLSLVQMSVVEIHPWGSRVDDLEHPDRMIFDLDPDPSVPWKRVTETAGEIRDRLKEFSLVSFLKTSGGKGLHVVVPLQRRNTWDEVKAFSKEMAEAMASDAPRLYISKATKAERKGKIFVDYLRNSRGATNLAAFSTRGREGAPVSLPVSWTKLATVGAQDYHVTDRKKWLAGLKNDPWKEFFKVRQSLPRSRKKTRSTERSS